MRIFVAALATETNTFAPFPTGRSGFEEYGITRRGSQMDGPLSGPLKVFRQSAERDGHELTESISAFAQPSGRTVRALYEELRDTILTDLKNAGPVDIVLLMLHGAMAAEGYDDCEGDIIGRARDIAPNATLGVEIDPHAHLTAAMVARADFILIAREYPHIDFDTRAHDLYALCLRKAKGEIAPVAALVDCRMIGFYPTFDEPMKGMVEGLRAASGQGKVLSVELGHGFPWGDVEDVGTRVLVYTDGDAALAKGEAERHAREFYDQRKTLALSFPDVNTSLDRARGLNGRTVLGDFADNPGGGAPGDATFFLKALLDRGVDDAVIGAIWDPQMAQVCVDAGVGATLDLRLGGKCGPTSGEPVDLTVEVMAVLENHSQGVFGQRTPLGRSAWVRHGGIDIVICSVRTQVFEPDAFTGLGVPMDNRKLVIVKSSNHYRAGFDGISDNLWHVSSPGCMSLDFPRVPYSKLTQPIFPMSEDPWAETGGPHVQLFEGAR
ncbi:MAG TPA: M81 family metallopeptidase [Caulobacteraceae bacterium]|jgi:microcystin degradation protein MlrC|nr:M81 family metallopeptidase [Caulobacteraceae bacterium]